jgi:hypothetical protein
VQGKERCGGKALNACPWSRNEPRAKRGAKLNFIYNSIQSHPSKHIIHLSIDFEGW